jgi:hypothetical protein
MFRPMAMTVGFTGLLDICFSLTALTNDECDVLIKNTEHKPILVTK